MKKVLDYCRNFLLLVFSFIQAYSQSVDEFSGEFSSWANVKKRFGAVGDGKKDDTKAIQKALDSLSVSPKNFNTGNAGYTTIYLPPGNYRITSTLILKGKIGINIIGEDPQRTSITWDGKEGQMMLWANGAAYFKISRITWNANNKKSITGIGLKWTTKWKDDISQSYASLNIEISDCNFIGKPLYGINGGTSEDGTNANDSEVTIQRCYFLECQQAGINITGFNALDYWVWDCRFLKCYNGIANSRGNYHAYRCYFEESTEADFMNDNGYYTSVRGCYSFNSWRFSHDKGASCNPFKRIFQGNLVKSKQGNEVHFPHIGKPVFVDNIFSKAINSGSENTLFYKTWCPGIYEVLSVGNKYALAQPFQITSSPKKIFAVNDVTKYNGELPVSKQNFLASQETMPFKSNRKIFDIPKNASSDKIQALINLAAGMKGARPIVHFGIGTYTLNKQLLIPAGCDMQLVGDGLIYASVIKRSRDFPKGKSMLKVLGPTDIVIRDIQFSDHDGTVSDIHAIEFVNIDQPGSTAFLDQLHISASTSIEMNELDYLYVQKQNSFFSTGNRVYGGKLVQEGKGTAGLYCYGGQFADLTVRGNGKFVSKDCWWEGPKRKPLDISGSGNITIDGVMIAPVNVDSNTTVSINNFNGRISIMNAYIQGAVHVMPNNPALKILLWNIHFYHAMNPTRFISGQSNFRGAFLGLSTQCFQTGDPNCGQIISKEDRLVKVPDEKSFLLEMLAQDRSAMPRRYPGKTPKASTIFLSRVSVGNSKTAVKFTK
ncbi:MAG: glycosyl hydrolase family 28-related protein [Flavitalea sp.]